MILHKIPYGYGHLRFRLPDWIQPESVETRKISAVPEPQGAVLEAISNPVGGISLSDFRGVRSVAIAINDKTRPVPNDQLLPPLLGHLEELGVKPGAIQFIIATGTHSRVSPVEYPLIAPQEILDRFPFHCHHCDDNESLVYLGTTSRDTPVWVNQLFAEADLRIVVGIIEPHQFQGFTGGVKGAAIGLAGRDTINHNHALMTSPKARLGRYSDNPARQDVEEIGQIIGVHFSLNALLNSDRQIVAVIAGDPYAVMEKGIPLSRQISQVQVDERFDLIIASPGGYPKDINLYQSQKALAHAGIITRIGGTVILTAACAEGTGSRAYELWMNGVSSHQEAIERFQREGFLVGPHKAVQIALDATRVKILLISELESSFVRKLLLTPVASIDEALETALVDLPEDANVGIMPQASSTIPFVRSK
jgi:nickel-dependent lactate racemase